MFNILIVPWLYHVTHLKYVERTVRQSYLNKVLRKSKRDWDGEAREGPR